MGHSADILLFTDSDEAKNILNSYLAHGDFFIHFANKSESGLNLITQKDFDIIIFEINQPMFSEIEYIEKIKMLNSRIPIVIVSEYFGETKNSVFGNSINEYVSKPFTMEKLINSVNTILRPETSLDSNNGHTELESKRLSILYEMSKSLNSITDFNLLLKTIINLAGDALNAERATIFIYDRSSNELWSRVGTGLDLKEIRFPVNKGIAGEVITKGYSVLTDNPYNHPAFNREFDNKTGFVTRNLLCVPMKNLKGILVGAFQVLNKKDGRFTAQDELFLSAMSASTAIAIENTLLHEENESKYREMVKLYDDLYTAQNMIVKETKHATISEIRGYINTIRQYDRIANTIKQLENSDLSTEHKEIVTQLGNAHSRIYSQLGGFMNNLLNEAIDSSKQLN
jgi:DNA-binding response OmpR family regulator